MNLCVDGCQTAKDNLDECISEMGIAGVLEYLSDVAEELSDYQPSDGLSATQIAFYKSLATQLRKISEYALVYF
ncbi:MAG: hypothetical protein N4J56_004635 [Chroococcidiopsis sp. SAG 2025]|uniref:hypothetical protein n=1 Tax=Chroococcidiopsis sp. SAG 2025 TaxID=171389 RepID=UPI0029371D96|nr:hypothetical protein [Chroococcidiopsis sp. SAG 2025]MDV2994981.1 hypothetical protein [Chroococcidiopsis sp. SAG 2025]